ncbi:MAG: GlsB/YeaQ/YmgE family stress response membrane protein [Cyanobacteria bacterium]|nr:GlsB/YeaQ/YmgE family stress response membrane protein [Cyanobacteriota bacterium]
MFIMYCIVAAVCAGIAAYLVPGTIPGGFLVSVIFGILGAWLGTSMIGGFGPSLFGVPIVPAILGSALLVFVLSLFARRNV